MTLREQAKDIVVDAWQAETPNEALDEMDGLIPADAVLVTEETLRVFIPQALADVDTAGSEWDDWVGSDIADGLAAAILARIREAQG